MIPFELNVIYSPILSIFFGTLVVSLKITRSLALSIFAALIKASIFTIYFGFTFDGVYTFLDDWSYLEGGRTMLHQDIGLTNLAENWEFALMIGRGDHFVYYLYNTYAFRLFGEGYYAPVALNILLTIAIAYFGTRLAVVEFSINKNLLSLLYLFLLLHPDILAWSNTMNGKDILVLLLHIFLLSAISLYWRGQNHKAMLIGLPTIFILLFLRFYVPILFSIALLLGILFLNGQRRLRYLFFSLGLTLLLSAWIGEGGFQYVINSLSENLVNPAYGLIRALLTPIPFNADKDYAFLNFPALFHWMLIPFAVLGLIHVWQKKTPFTRFFTAYFLVFIGLYAVYGELQGPRHRVQLDYAWAVLQFIGVMKAVGVMKVRNIQSSAIFTT